MKIRMLGTGYGECKVKKFASKDYRHRGGVIVNSKILIDAPSDIFDIADELGLSDVLEDIRVVLISHSHAGHFSPEAILKLAARRKYPCLRTRRFYLLLRSRKISGNIPFTRIRKLSSAADAG